MFLKKLVPNLNAGMDRILFNPLYLLKIVIVS